MVGLGAAKRYPGLDKSAFPKVWNLISSLPKPKHETLEKDAAIKTIKEAGLSASGTSVAKDEPLGIAQDANVVVDSAEYVSMTCEFMRKADNTFAAPSLAYILRTVSSLVPLHTRSSSVSTRAYNCTSPELAMLCAARNCRTIQNTIEPDVCFTAGYCIYDSSAADHVSCLMIPPPISASTTCGAVSALQWIAVDLLSTRYNASVKSYRVLVTTGHPLLPSQTSRRPS